MSRVDAPAVVAMAVVVVVASKNLSDAKKQPGPVRGRVAGKDPACVGAPRAGVRELGNQQPAKLGG